MSARGDLLELLHDAVVRARPATLTVVEWSHAARSSEAFARFMAQQHSGTAYAASSRGPAQEESAWSTTLCFEHESRFREDADGSQAGQRFLVRDGSDWLTWDAAWGTVSSEVEPGAPSANYAFLLDPVGIVGELLLEPRGTAEHAGRPVVLARGLPREGTSVGGMLLRLGAGADALDLAVDAERGALLRVEARLGGEPFRRFDVTRITYGPIDPATFSVAPPPGAPDAAGWPRPQQLPLHEVAARAPFTVLVPERVPEGWRLSSMLMQGRDEPRLPASATLSYTSLDGAYGATLQERAVEAADPEGDWRTWRRNGDLEVADEGEHVDPRHHVRLERGGTVVELSGGDAELLAQLARSLVPAPTEPPRVP
jgi:hypothetical protein